MRKIAVLGSTGSIGTQALDIIKRNGEKLKAELLSCNSRLDSMYGQLKEFRPRYAILPNTDEARKLADEFKHIFFFYGKEGLREASQKCEYDYMLNSLLGISGLIPTFNCLKTGRNVALANKETLVAGGSLIMDIAKNNNVKIIPVDSEHSAIFQCLQGTDNKIKKITLTASGGAFRGKNRQELIDVTPAEALKHPNWDMGAKITIDSATLMNKGFEIIEAKWLFDVESKKIDVVIHDESIIHSMVEFEDNSTLAQLGEPNMTVPISYAFSYPERWETSAKPIDLVEISTLKFSRPDYETFKCLKLAIQAMEMGGSYTIALNAANEVLVSLFLKNKIRFTDIGDVVEMILDSHSLSTPCTPEEVLMIDNMTRDETLKKISIKRESEGKN